MYGLGKIDLAKTQQAKVSRNNNQSMNQRGLTNGHGQPLGDSKLGQASQFINYQNQMVTDGDDINHRIDTESTNSQIEKSFIQTNMEELRELKAKNSGREYQQYQPYGESVVSTNSISNHDVTLAMASARKELSRFMLPSPK